MRSIFLTLASIATLLTAFAHSYFGEKRLIQPLVASNDGVMSRLLAKQVIRMAWHLTSLLWLMQALLLLRIAIYPATFDPMFVGAVGSLHLLVGLVDGAVTRGQHIGWPMLTAVGVLALLALI